MKIFEYILGFIINVVYEFYYFVKFGTQSNKEVCSISIKDNKIYFYYNRLRIVAQDNELSFIKIIKQDAYIVCLCYFRDELKLECIIDENLLNELIIFANLYDIEIKMGKHK
jgi:hypothetical protein